MLGMVAQEVLGGINRRKQDDRAMGNQLQLMQEQFGNQKQLNKQAHNLNFAMWNKTNFGAQMKHLMDAGLSPGLFYGGGGKGGTTGGQSGGSAAGGNAPGPQGLGMLNPQLELIKAQKKDLEASANLKNAQATKTGGVDTDEARSRIDINRGIISLNLSQEQLNNSAETLNQSKEQVNDSVIKLNEALRDLNKQKEKESLNNTKVTKETLDWMEKTGLNPNDAQLGKTIQYLSSRMGKTEEEAITIIGGAIALKEIAKFLFPF